MEETGVGVRCGSNVASVRMYEPADAAGRHGSHAGGRQL